MKAFSPPTVVLSDAGSSQWVHFGLSSGCQGLSNCRRSLDCTKCIQGEERERATVPRIVDSYLPAAAAGMHAQMRSIVPCGLVDEDMMC